MKKSHIIKQGECMLSLAEKYFYSSWKDIYYHPSNAALRQTRSDPMCLMPGDVVNLPDKKIKRISISMEKTHNFVIKRPKSYFTMIVVDGENNARKDVDYTLSFTDVPADPVKGTTGADGFIKAQIPYGCKEGELTLIMDRKDPACKLVEKVLFGHKDPVEETSGLQSRLNDLNYHCGNVDNNQGECTQSSVDCLWGDHFTGEPDEEQLKDKLKNYHPSLHVYE